MSMPFDHYPSAVRVIDLLANGLTLTAACDTAGISYGTFRSILKSEPELADAFVSAEQRGYDVMADALLDPDGHLIYGRTDAKMAAILAKNLQWFLARRRPSVYGDKQTIEHTITADKAILEALLRGKARAHGLLPPPDEILDLVPIEDDLSSLI